MAPHSHSPLLLRNPCCSESGFDLFTSIIGNLFITKLTTLHYLEEVSQEEKNSKKSPIHRCSDLPNFLGVKVHQEKLANLFSHT